jgi:hypothetical protein
MEGTGGDSGLLPSNTATTPVEDRIRPLNGLLAGIGGLFKLQMYLASLNAVFLILIL